MLVVLLQQIAAEVALAIAPHRMHVVGTALRVVVFDDEGRPAETVVVTLARFVATHPGEAQMTDSRRGDALQLLIREVLPQVSGVNAKQAFDDRTLRIGQRCKPRRR